MTNDQPRFIRVRENIVPGAHLVAPGIFFAALTV